MGYRTYSLGTIDKEYIELIWNKTQSYFLKWTSGGYSQLYLEYPVSLFTYDLYLGYMWAINLTHWDSCERFDMMEINGAYLKSEEWDKIVWIFQVPKLATWFWDNFICWQITTWIEY